MGYDDDVRYNEGGREGGFVVGLLAAATLMHKKYFCHTSKYRI